MPLAGSEGRVGNEGENRVKRSLNRPVPAANRPVLLPCIALITAFVVSFGYLSSSSAQAASSSPVGVPSMPQAGDMSSLLSAISGDSASPTTAGLQTVLSPILSSPALGSTVQVSISQPFTGDSLYTSGGDAPAIPASTNKILSSAAAMNAYGADHRIATRVVQGASPNEIILVGGGDPLLRADPSTDFPDSATLKDLADQTATAIKNQQSQLGPQPVKLRFDDSLFSGPMTAPSWAPNYVSDGLVSRITALMANDGFVGGISQDPSLSAARDFSAKLKGLGITVAGGPTRTTAAQDATQIASVSGAPLSSAVGYALEHSDNTMAEVLAHLAGAQLAGSGSFTGGADAVEQTLSQLGISTDGVTLLDGSGLSRDDRVPPSVFTALLGQIAQNKGRGLWAIGSGFPVAGFTGTLDERFSTQQTRAGLGDVRAKTGTLTGVSALSGFVVDADGALLAFSFMASATTDTLGSELAWDKAASALAQCGCR